MDGPQIRATILPLSTAGENGAQIEARLHQLRGTPVAGAADVGAVGGALVLTGPMMHAQVGRVLPAGPLAQLNFYPTGHDPATRTEAELWEDVRVGGRSQILQARRRRKPWPSEQSDSAWH